MAVQEDDATELQFPKGMFNSKLSCDSSTIEICGSCYCPLHFPYIQCTECIFACDDRVRNLCICLHCFAKGREFNSHKNNHSYTVIKDIYLFNKDWNTSDEILLLDSIVECGLGNWDAVSKYLPDKSPDECKRHFLQCYIDQNSSPCGMSNSAINDTSQAIPYNFGSYDPPRPFINSTAYCNMAGYNAARGDFLIEFQNQAESIIQELDISTFECNEDDSLDRELQFAMLDIYRRTQAERHLRKKMIREHGLINIWKSQHFLHSYKNIFSGAGGLLPKLHQLLGFEELLYFLEGLQYQEELSQKIRNIKDFRMSGLQKRSQTSIYNNLKNKRMSFNRLGQKLASHGSDKRSFGGVHNLSLYTMMQVSHTRRSIPLEISTEKDFDKLSEEERELASRLRILPTNFLKFKETLINESIKNNGLTLLQARHIIKIDVNKVSKIYSLLTQKGYIYPPS